jgi:hypothetical protein
MQYRPKVLNTIRFNKEQHKKGDEIARQHALHTISE